MTQEECASWFMRFAGVKWILPRNYVTLLVNIGKSIYSAHFGKTEAMASALIEEFGGLFLQYCLPQLN